MPRSVLISRKILILNDAISKVQALLVKAYHESGLVVENKTKVDSEEVLGGDKEKRKGILVPLIVLYEKITEQSAGGHKKILHEQEYELEIPAYKLQEGYVNYLNFVFYDHINSKDTEKQNPETLEEIIDNEYVYVKEILLRLFTAAISIDKNNSASAQEAIKIIDCLDLFLTKINQTTIMHDKSRLLGLILISSSASDINFAFAEENEEWVYLLRQMQQFIQNMHHHTASISNLATQLSRTKIIIAQQLAAYISKNDIPKEDFLPPRIQYTLFKQEMACLEEGQKNTPDKLAIHSLSMKNYKSKIVNFHQQKVIETHKENDVVKELYNLLARTNIFLEVLDEIDILLSTTGWVLLISNVLKLNNLSKRIKEYAQKAKEILKFKNREFYLKGKKGIEDALLANKALSGIASYHKLNIAIDSVNEIESSVILECISGIIKTAVVNLVSLQKDLDCELVSSDNMKVFENKNLVTAINHNTPLLPASSSVYSAPLANASALAGRSSTATTPVTIRSATTTTTNEITKSNPLPFNKGVTLSNFNRLAANYEDEETFFNSTADDTAMLFSNVRNAKNDQERAGFVSSYMKTREKTREGRKGRFYKILLAADKNETLFIGEKPEKGKSLSNTNNLAVTALSSTSNSSSSTTSKVVNDSARSSIKLPGNNDVSSETSEYHSNIFYEEKRKKALEVLKKSKALNQKQEIDEKTKESKEKTLT